MPLRTPRRTAGRSWVAGVAGAILLIAFAAGGRAAGPPFPAPVTGQAVYDEAGVFRPATIADVEATIDAIEARTGAEVVVYSQVVDYGITFEEAEAHAIALMDQWGVGRRGIDDGLVVLFDLDPSLEHGQVVLYAGPGYRATYLTNAERQAIFDDDMLPFLRDADLDGALRVAMERIDAATTPENAARLQAARIVDAVLGLIGAPLAFILVAGWATWNWRRYGRDPVVADSDSIHVPAPPPDLTAAAGALVFDGRSSRRTLTTALLDLASRGEITFREEKSGLFGRTTKVGVEIGAPRTDDPRETWLRERAARRPIGEAERFAARRLNALAMPTDGARYVTPDELLAFGEQVPKFDEQLERYAVTKGWFRGPPSKVMSRWAGLGTAEAVGGGIILFALGFGLPSQGFVLVGAAILAAGIVTIGVARAMPARSRDGARLRVWLAAYRRTLEKTMAQARSMTQVVEEAALDWLETPDQAVVWGVALGLQDEVNKVLERSLEDVRANRTAASSTYLPSWYQASGATAGGGSSGGGGLFSSSAIPNFAAMTAVLSSIGNSPSSSGDGGGFGGGGSGGGGGGSGGGF